MIVAHAFQYKQIGFKTVSPSNQEELAWGGMQKAYFGVSDGTTRAVTIKKRVNGQITISESEGESEIVLSAIPAWDIPRMAARRSSE